MNEEHGESLSTARGPEMRKGVQTAPVQEEGRQRYVNKPHYAWLAPLVGLLLVFAVSLALVAFDAVDGEADHSAGLAQGCFSLAVLLATVVWGTVKSIQCLIGGRHLAHGAVGATVNVAVALLLTGVLAAGLLAASSKAALSTPPRAIARMISDSQGSLPFEIDELTTLVSMSQGPDNVLILDHQVHGVPKERLTPQIMGTIEQRTRKHVAATNPYPLLRGTGAEIHYVFRYEDGSELHRFVVKP